MQGNGKIQYMKELNIIIDENIPFAEKIFSRIGHLNIKNSVEISKGIPDDTDILVVRSKTEVNQTLLKNSRVKFVGTATAGIDHIDTDYLKKNEIGFSNAAGSNANSVVEYIFAVLFGFCSNSSKCLDQLSLGIIGTGNIGGVLADRAEKLGINVLRNDPWLEEKGVKKKFHKLDELMDADIITLHTPLTKEGRYPTYHLFDKKQLDKLNKKTLLINSSRGAVVDNNYLLQMLEEKKIWGAVLDVWENEPDINLQLLEKVYLGTPHIAGYSFDGKVNGSVMIFNKICDHLHIDLKLDVKDIIPKVEDNIIETDPSGSCERVIHNIIKKIYDIDKDFEKLKEMNNINQKAAFFNKLRKEYPIRREFFNYKVRTDKYKKWYRILTFDI